MSELKRNITEWEETVIRHVHHEFEGLTQVEAAERLNVSEAKISRTIAGIIEKAKCCRPIRILLPFLSKRQYDIYRCVVERGLTNAQAAEELNIPVATVGNTLTRIRNKGMHIPKRKPVQSYHDAGMADKIKFEL